MAISSINRIKTIATQMITGSSEIVTIYEATGLTLGSSLIENQTIVNFNCFIKNLRAYALIQSLDKISLPNFTLGDSETDKLYKTLNTEWNSARKQLTLFIANQPNTSPSGDGWFKVGSISLLNPSGYPYRVYNLMDLYTDSLAIELGDNGKIGARIDNVGFGLLESTDEVVLYGSYLEEIFVSSAEANSNGNSNGTVEPPTPVVSFPVSTLFRISASDINLSNNSLVSVWQQAQQSSLVVEQQIEENKPVLRTNIINGKKAVYFDGNSSQFLNIKNATDSSSPINLIPSTGDWAIFLVANSNSGYGVALSNFSSDKDPYSLIDISGDSIIVAYYDNNNTRNIIRADSFYNSGFRIYVLASNSNNVTLYINGDSFPVGTIEGGFTLATDYLSSAYIGCNYVASNHFSGYISDIGVINNSDITAINSIGQYFKTLYNLTWRDIQNVV